MSGLGQKRTYAVQKTMSALPQKATAKADFRKRSCLLDQYANGLSEGDFKFFTTALRNNHFLLRGPNAVLMLQWNSSYSNTLRTQNLSSASTTGCPDLMALCGRVMTMRKNWS